MKVFYRQTSSMGTRFELLIPGMDEQQGEDLFSLVHTELNRLENKLSIFNPRSDLFFINQHAYGEDIPLDPELEAIFCQIKSLYSLTNGYFDVTMRPLFDYYSQGGKHSEPPNEIKEQVGFEKVIINEGKIRFLIKGMSLDLGGYGKGYAVKQVVEILGEHFIDHALVNFGGSLIYGMGNHPYGSGWKVSLEMPEYVTNNEFELFDEALSTSGNSLNNQKKFGNSGHIIDPITFQLRSAPGMVAVKAKKPEIAEALSTAFFGAGEEKVKDWKGMVYSIYSTYSFF